MTRRRLLGAVLTLVGAAAFTACVWSVWASFQVDGGSCATGGPYVIAHQCSSGGIRLALIGFFGGMLFAGVWAGGTSMLGRRASAAGLAAGCVGFGVFGWRFISLYLHPGGGQGGSFGFLIPGIMFEVFVAVMLTQLIWGIKADLRRDNGPDDRAARPSFPPIVKALVPVAGFSPAQEFGYRWKPSENGSLAVPVPQSMASPLVALGVWLATSAVGVATGVLLLSSLMINLLK